MTPPWEGSLLDVADRDVLSRLAGEKLAGTPYAAYFLSGESEVPTGRGSGPAFLHTTAVMR
jgi:hypothetical protein